MDINWIVGVVFLVIFIIFVIIGTLKRRGATVENLTVLPEEKILFEENDVRVDQKFRGEGIVTIYRRSFVRVTNKRIVIAQTPWFGKKTRYLISIIYYHGETGPELGNYGGIFVKGAGLEKGFGTFYTDLQHITIETNDNKPVVKITIPMKDPGPFLKEPRIFIYPLNVSQYQQILK